MSTPPVDVRQCPKCSQPAVLLVMEWQHTTFGVSTNESTREYRCQACGEWYVRRARTRVIALWIVGVLLSIPCLLGAPVLYLAWREGTFEQRLPLQLGVPVPRLRFPGGPPKRTCGKCNGTATAIRITRNTHNGVPTGTDYDYQCAGCGLQFSTQNFLGHVFSTLSGAAMGGAAAGFFFLAQSAGWKWGGTGVMAVGAGFFAWHSLEGVLNRVKHKAVVETVL